MSHTTITINGKLYDARTGMPVTEQTSPTDTDDAASPKRSPLHHSKSIHTTQQKSQTLNRRIVKKSTPGTPQKTTPQITKSPSITKFAPHPSGVKPRIMTDVGPHQATQPHPSLIKAHQKLKAKKQAVVKPALHTPAHIVKNQVIKEALEKAPSKTDTQKQTKRRSFPRFASVASATLALLLLGGYFTYLNMPNLSVRVAAAQAGINASYPEYRPDGYGLKGPIGYTDGQVTMQFAANAGPQNYTVTQVKSSWDSSAVLDNYVKEKAGDNYITYNERGLTIYTFDGNAAWVNGGILYTISGDAPLSSDQIRRIAVSMS